MTPQRAGKRRGRPRTSTHPPGKDLSRYIAFAEVLRRVPVSDKTLLRWATLGLRGCPPIYELSGKIRVMDAAQTEKWIRSNRKWEREA